ncbi:MAG: Cyclic pyranopterin monophosphate synthase 1 [bacterium ADurb.Bin243]|nr:MAG: Cyclic pyranopterin monophosphate synthase 1 [bacterium ADurb.Bin243]
MLSDDKNSGQAGFELKKGCGGGKDYCLSMTRSVCHICENFVNAKIVSDGKSVFLRKLCPSHHCEDVMIAADLKWYLSAVNSRQLSGTVRGSVRAIDKGCPHDCGICAWHENSCVIPVFSVTNSCDMNCPICFTYNRSDKMYFMSRAEMKGTIDGLIEKFKKLDLVNITGGEPMSHPDIFAIIEEAKRPEIGRITINSNGSRIARDEEFAAGLARHGVYVILSFDTFDPETSKKIHGADIVELKLKALANLEKYNIPTTILNVAIKGVNDREIGEFVKLAMTKDFIRSLTIQNMTYTGFGGRSFEPGGHITIDEVIGEIAKSGIGIGFEDFRPHPRSHPLCYSTCYVIRDAEGGSGLFSMAALATGDEYAKLLSAGYLLRPDDELYETVKAIIERNWLERKNENASKVLKNLIRKIFPPGAAMDAFQRQKIAEKYIKSIYIHSHMDAYNYDAARIVRCGDLVPQTDGRYIPACSYNMFYRKYDERFWSEEPEAVK